MITSTYIRRVFNMGTVIDPDRSSKKLFTKCKGILTNNQIAQVVNCHANINVTLININQSKGKKLMYL